MIAPFPPTPCFVHRFALFQGRLNVLETREAADWLRRQNVAVEDALIVSKQTWDIVLEMTESYWAHVACPSLTTHQRCDDARYAFYRTFFPEAP